MGDWEINGNKRLLCSTGHPIPFDEMEAVDAGFSLGKFDGLPSLIGFDVNFHYLEELISSCLISSMSK